MNELNPIQRMILACDDYIERLEIRNIQAKDKAAHAFMAGVINVWMAELSTEAQNRAGILGLIVLGGYGRIHQMASELRAGEAHPLTRCADEGDK